ncbi:small-conductance mechanosensitive channel [Nostoc minutum NIES-26]|uniref:Small-conductance mechanosensitive channel n=1 Tax=Nostoc minutum NIES-26 TaxID=1844469 RepID=A0A367QV38_9NOSO|nr:small-conductance mechanosensitive channel [Nostoc minutum NIES-26]
MNPEESQTPELNDEWLEQVQEQNSTVKNLENSSVDSVQKTEMQTSSVETQLDDANSQPPISNAEVTSGDELIEKPDAEFAVQLEAETAALGSEIESKSDENSLYAQAVNRVAELQRTEAALKEEIANLQNSYTTLQAQLSETQTSLGRLVQESLVQLEQRKQTLQISVEQLERRQERIRNEMRTTFAGTSQDLAIRVQGFKDYLTGSLQDLAAAAEQLQLVPPAVTEREKPSVKEIKQAEPQPGIPQFAPQQFQDTTKQIRRLIDQYRNQPDYYGPAWQLRRTFEPVHAERASNWFFSQGGRGALRTMGSRLQNILIGSAVISILHKLYGDRVRTLVLANTPERLGEWRRGLQDCLGIGRPDFGPDRGVVLFETPEALAQKADRLVKANQLPLILIDDSEEQISLALLQFPLWLAFAPDPKTVRNYDNDF